MAVPAGDRSAWYLALAKPALTPPGWLFPVAWTVLYILMGFALAMILNARGARLRGIAIALFSVQLALNLVWTPLFFGAHQVGAALLVSAAMLVAAIATTLAFGRIRTAAAWLCTIDWTSWRAR